MVSICFGGEAAATDERVEGYLRAHYGNDLAAYDIDLHYAAGRGYRVRSATCTRAAVVSNGPGISVPDTKPITEDVSELLEAWGFPVFY